MSDDLQLSDLQLDLLRILWDRGEASASEVHAALAGRELAPTTVATMLARLEKRGVLTHRAVGRQFVYRPAVSEQQVRRSMLERLTETFFRGDVSALVSHLVAGRDVAPGDLERVKRLLAEHAPRGEGEDDA